MKFRLGPIIEVRPKLTQAGWHQVPLISPHVVFATTIGVAVAMVLVLESFWRLQLGLGPRGLGEFAWSFLVMIVLHESLHACVLPGFPWSSRISMGLWPTRGFFVSYHGAMSRERWLTAAALPLLVLTGGPVALAGFGIQSRFWATVATWNAAAACSDIVLFLLVLAEVPRGATILTENTQASWRVLPK